MEKISSLIVEDEKRGLENLQIKLEEHCPQVELIGASNSGEQAIEDIKKLKPELVFLDIQLGTMTGFDVLETVPNVGFEVIFTTAYDQYALKAFKNNALHYLLKPIRPEELKLAVEKAHKLIKGKEDNKLLSRIAVPVSNGLRFISVDEIIHCEAVNNYCLIHLFNGKTVTVTRTLGNIEEKLKGHSFFRIHRSHLINLDYLESFLRESGGKVVLSNGTEMRVGRNYRDAFIRKYEG